MWMLFEKRKKFLPSAGIRTFDRPSRSQPVYAIQIVVEM